MNHNDGFTVIEVMIVLAISSFLFLSTVSIFTSQQKTSEFRQGIQDIETKFQDIINDTSTGYYDALSNYDCQKGVGPSAPPTFVLGGTNSQGTNLDCIFIGKAVLLRPAGTPEVIEISPVVGNRQFQPLLPGSKAREVQTYSEANPTTVYVSPKPDLTQTYPLKNGIRVKSDNSDLVGFYGSFATYVQGTVTASGAQRTDMVKHTPALLSRDGVKQCIQDVAGCYVAPTTPPTPWIICFEAPGSNLTAQLTIDGQSLTTKLEMIPC